jgi:3-oxoacyl-[acyl-carrier protein] reductase
MSNFKGKIVLVTGASRGIGRGISKLLAASGAKVIGTATRLPDNEVSGVSEWQIVDFSVPDSLAAFEEWLLDLGRLDVCINNAGINIIKPIVEVTNKDYERISAVNLEGPYRTSRAVASVMKQHGGGRIVNIASIWACVSKSWRSLYSTTKSGLVGMTRALAVELAEDSILVNAVSPGFTLTDLTRASLSPEQMKELADQVPIRRFAEVQEIARVIAFLASEDNTYITGQNLVVDGGFTIV